MFTTYIFAVVNSSDCLLVEACLSWVRTQPKAT